MAKTTKAPAQAKSATPLPVTLASNVPAAQIIVSADAFRKWRELDAKAKAMTKEAEAAKTLCGFPDTDTLVKHLGVTPETSGAGVICDRNGAPLGRVTVFYRGAFEMPAAFVSRIS